MSYQKKLKALYLEEQSKCGIEAGDLVKVTSTAPPFSNGWNSSWAIEQIDRYVKKVGVVQSKPNSNEGVLVKFNDGVMFRLPFFVLEKICHCQFNPFQAVLVRDRNDEKWKAAFFANMTDVENSNPKYVTTDRCEYNMCIQYDGNEHLYNTNMDVE